MSPRRSDIGTNSIEGTLPPQIGACRFMSELRLYFNRLEGTIPGSFANLTSLTYLNVHGNRMSGTVPGAMIARMPRLLRLCVPTGPECATPRYIECATSSSVHAGLCLID